MRALDELTNMQVRWLLGALCVLAFAPGLTSGLLHYEDAIYLYMNPVMKLQGWPGFFEVWSSARAWRGEFVEFFPLRDTIYWVCWQLWERAGTPYHLASLFFHVASTLLVFQLVARLEPSRWVAIVTATIFAVHPIHVESVTWIASLKDPMFTTFMLASLLAAQRFADERRAGSYVTSLGFLVLALLVKSIAIVTPVLMIMLERMRATPTPWRTIAARVLLPAIISGAFLVEFVGIGKAKGIVGGLHGGSLFTHTVLGLWSQARYATEGFAPTQFDLIECFEPVQGWGDLRLWAGVATMVLVGLAVTGWRRSPRHLFFIGWHFVILLPVSNIVPFPAVMADRYLYASSLAACWLMAWALERWAPRSRGMLAGAVVLTFCAVTMYRSGLFHDEDALWAGTDEDPACLADRDFPAAQVHLVRSWTAKTPQLRLAALERAIASPAYTDVPVACEVLVPGAMVAIELEQPDKAFEWSRKALRLCPQNGGAWHAAMLSTLHRRADLARTAAGQAQKFEPSPVHALYEVLTALEVSPDEALARDVETLVSKAPAETCPSLLSWRAKVSASAGAPVDETVRRCLH